MWWEKPDREGESSLESGSLLVGSSCRDVTSARRPPPTQSLRRRRHANTGFVTCSVIIFKVFAYPLVEALGFYRCVNVSFEERGFLRW